MLAAAPLLELDSIHTATAPFVGVDMASGKDASVISVWTPSYAYKKGDLVEVIVNHKTYVCEVTEVMDDYTRVAVYPKSGDT